MRKTLLIVFATFFIDCITNGNTPQIENKKTLAKWKVVEVLAGPGDGSWYFSDC